MTRKLNICFACLFVASSCFSQGITRRSGLGLRLSYWNVNDKATRMYVSSSTQSTDVAVKGVGLHVFYFTRLRDYLFLETSLGVIADAEVNVEVAGRERISSSSIIPLLLGVR